MKRPVLRSPRAVGFGPLRLMLPCILLASTLPTAPQARAAPEITAPVAKPTVSFRWVESDPKTIDSMIAMVSGRKLPPAEIDSRIEQAMQRRLLENIASFQTEFASGTSIKFPVAAPAKPARAKTAPEPDVSVELEATLSMSGGSSAVHLRYSAERRFKVVQPSVQKCGSAVVVPASGWVTLDRWQRDKRSSLLLVKFNNLPVPAKAQGEPPANAPLPRSLRLEVEWLETRRANLPQLEKATPDATRKAIDWLRQNSTLVGADSLTGCSGSGSGHDEMTQSRRSKRDDEEVDESMDAGIDIRWEPSFRDDGSLQHSLRISYQPLRTSGRKDSKGWSYDCSRKAIQPDVPSWFLPNDLPDNVDPVTIIVVTAKTDTIR